MFFYEPLHMDIALFADQQELIYMNSVWTQDAVWKNCQEQWMIGMDGERESRKSVLSVLFDDDDDDVDKPLIIHRSFGITRLHYK